MWLQLLVAFLLAVVLLFVPGVLVARAARFSPVQCLGYGPLASIAGYTVACLVFERLGVPTNVMTVAGGVAAFALLAFVLAAFVRRWRQLPTADDPLGTAHRFGWLQLVAPYLAVSLLVSIVLFLKPMHGADVFVQAFDNVSHLGTIRSALNAELLDPLGAVGYYTAVDEASSPFAEGYAFYPEMWHMLVAMVASFLGDAISVSINAVNYAFSFVVMPLGAAVLFSELFGSDRRMVLLGALACVAFEAFPWEMLVYGPLYPNMAAFALVPAMVSLLLVLLKSDKIGRAARLKSGAFFLVGMVSCASIQPNAVFTVGVLVMPYLVLKASRLPERLKWARGKLLRWRFIFGAVAAAAICAVWVFMYELPVLYTMVHCSWRSISGIGRTLYDIVLLGLVRHPVQPVVALLVIAGIVRTCRQREWLWLSFSYLFCCVMYFACAATDGFWDSFLTGFWYTDQYRIAAMMALAGMPLFALGLDWLLDGVSRAVAKRGASETVRGRVAPAIAVALVAVLVFFPTPSSKDDNAFKTAFGRFRERVAYLYDAHSFRHLSFEELQFAEKAQEIVGGNGLIANEPFDGSVYLYGGIDAPVYYKNLRGFGGESETSDSVLIREHLNEIADNAAVQQAVRDTNVHYVLQLDKDNVEEQPTRHGGYHEGQWTGISSIDDDTPGFTLVLSDDDMRLYKINDEYFS